MSHKERVYQKVKSLLKQEISSMEIGQRIAARTELIEKFQVTRTTIDRAINELTEDGYLHSVKGSGTYVADKAKSLFAKNTQSIGIVIPNIQFYNYPGIVRGITDVAEKYSINVIICNTDNLVSKQKHHIQQLINSKINGVIIIPPSSSVEIESFELLRNHNIPFVFVNHGISGIFAPISTQNNFHGAYMATEYLINLGHKKIAFLSRPLYSTNKERYHGYMSALANNNIPFDSKIVYFEDYIPGDIVTSDALYGVKSIKHVLSKVSDIDAVVCTDDRIALNAINEAIKMGIRVPEDISFLGFDNSEVCDICSVKITSISFDRYRIGANAANLLLQKLNEIKEDGLDIITTMPEIVIRESVLDRSK